MSKENRVETGELLPARQEAQELVKTGDPSDPIEAALLQIVRREVTPESVQAVRELCGIVREVRADKARQEYNQALAAFQQEISGVQATRVVPNTDGSVRYVFAPIEEIMEATREARTRHGFSISFAQEITGPDRIIGICLLHHRGGHTQATSFTARIGSGLRGCSEAQSDAATYTLASRYALLAALGLPVQKDTDARLEGACISADAARDLAARAKKAGIDEAAFLRLAGAESFATIREHKLPILEQVLREKKKPSPPPEPPAPSPLSEQQEHVSKLCGKLAERGKEKGKKTDADKVLAYMTKQICGDSMLLGELSLDQAIAVREALEETLKEQEQ